MASNIFKVKDRGVVLSTLWVFATLNYLYCDVLTLMDSEVLAEMLTGKVGDLEMTPEFLLAGGILMEIPMVSVVLSRLLKYKLNRWVNIMAGGVMTLVQLMSLLVNTPSVYYLFFSLVEISTTAAIVWIAWRWKENSK